MANIFVIDDQPYMKELIEGELADEGHHITCIKDSEYVMCHIEESRPDLILLDLYLNGFEGWELLNEIKGHDPTVPVLIVTAYDTFFDDPRLARADGYVIKSINTNELKEKIHEKLTMSAG